MSQIQKGLDKETTSIRVSDKFRTRLAKTRAKLTLKDGIELSMEELLTMMADAYDREETKRH